MEKTPNIFKVVNGNGYFCFKLEDVLNKQNKTKYSLAKHLESEYKVINRYAKGNLSRLDLSVLAKICDYCNCRLEDIIEYVPNNID